MRDREAILRFFALCHNLPTYLPPMKRFLNREMEHYGGMTEQVSGEMTQLFRKCVQSTLTVFGDHAFKRFYPGTADNPNGRWEPNRMNMALYDAVMVGFAPYDRNQVTGRSDAVRDALVEMMCGDTAFVDAINLSTSGNEQMQTRMHKWTAELHEVLLEPLHPPRLFPPELKRQLFEANPICQLCSQTIQLLDDAHVDHGVRAVAAWRADSARERQTDPQVLQHGTRAEAKAQGLQTW